MILPVANVHVVSDIGEELAPLVGHAGDQPIIVSEAGLIAAGLVQPVEAALGVEVLAVPAGEPQLGTVCDLATLLGSRQVDTVVAVGGGSILDTAKLAARLVEDPGGLEMRLRGAYPFPPGVAVVAMPTTAGSGAEVTRTAIVSHGGRKTWAWDERLRPELAVLAPTLTVGLPRAATVASGLDAFVHAVEAATGGRATTRISALGAEAAGMIFDFLPQVVRDPHDVDARSSMLLAANMAGVAIDACGTGIGHAVGHALASLGPIPHGVAVMIGLRAGLEWTLEHGAPAYDDIAARLAPEHGPRALPAAFDAMLDAVGFTGEMRRWTPPDPTALAAEFGMPDHLPMRLNNARPITDDDIAEVVGTTLEFWTR
jgi:alcohol dehydrogenase